MAKDAELDRLHSARESAFLRKQAAHKVQESAWNKRKAAGDTQHQAFEDKDRAWHAQEDSWNELQRMRDSYNPQIEHLKAQQEISYQRMSAAFAEAAAAFDRHERGTPGIKSAEGKT